DAGRVSDPRQHIGDRIGHHGRVPLYQLALTTPGTSPLRARFRKQMRHILNLRRKARLLPQRPQRLCSLTLNFSLPRLARTIFDVWAMAFSAFGGALLPKRHPQVGQERAALLVGLGGGDDGDVHSLDLVDLVVVDLGEDDLLSETQRVVPLAVKRLGGDALKV